METIFLRKMLLRNQEQKSVVPYILWMKYKLPSWLLSIQHILFPYKLRFLNVEILNYKSLANKIKLTKN